MPLRANKKNYTCCPDCVCKRHSHHSWSSVSLAERVVFLHTAEIEGARHLIRSDHSLLKYPSWEPSGSNSSHVGQPSHMLPSPCQSTAIPLPAHISTSPLCCQGPRNPSPLRCEQAPSPLCTRHPELVLRSLSFISIISISSDDSSSEFRSAIKQYLRRALSRIKMMLNCFAFSTLTLFPSGIIHYFFSSTISSLWPERYTSSAWQNCSTWHSSSKQADTQLCYSGHLSLLWTTPLVTLFIQDCYPCSSHALLQHPQPLMSVPCPLSLEETPHDSISSFWPFPPIQIIRASIYSFLPQLQHCSYSMLSFLKCKLSASCSAFLLLPFSSPLSVFSLTITLHASECPGN